MDASALPGAMGRAASSGQARAALTDTESIAIVPGSHPAGGGGSVGSFQDPGPSIPASLRGSSVVLLDLAGSNASGVSAPWKPASRPGGGAAMAPRGGSGSGAASVAVAAIQGRSPLPQTPKSPAPPPTIPGVFTGSPSAVAAPALAAPAVTRNAAAQRLNSGAGIRTNDVPSTGLGGGAFIAENPSSTPYGPTSIGVDSPLTAFPYFPLYTLDDIQGNVIFPGQYQLATLDGNVDLRAQSTSGVTFSWNTTNLTHATSITTSGTGNYDLTFTWDTLVTTAAVDSVTLTATDASSHQETQTYDFQVPAGNTNSNTGIANWPATLPPDTVLPSDQSWTSQYVSVDANSGALDTTIPLPSYNPNVPGVALTYDSLTADPRPIIVVPHTLDGSQAVPSKVNATLTFNGTAGTTWYYNTSTLIPGDVQQIALQANATALSTNRYSYSVQVVDQRTANTTFTYSGTATVLNQSTSAFGDGWTLQGLEQVIAPTGGGGVILSLGEGGQSLWFSGSPGVGGNYTTPAGDFSTLTKTSSGYTRTLSDGTQVTFNSSGYENATIDLNGLHTTYAYNGSNQLTSVTDPYTNVTTLTYSGSYLSTIKDPAGRIATFTYSGSQLQAVQQADGSHVTLTYDASGRLTQYKDPNGKAVTVSYDASERVGTLTRPDSTNQTFSAFQEQGWTNSGTSGSPAAATLLAASASSYTDPNANTTQMRPDWYGLGTTGQMTDALGNVTTLDYQSNGLPSIVIDRLNRISQFTYDSLGNTTEQIYPDGNTDQFTYNSDSEPLTHTDANGHTTSYTYDTHGNLTGIQDPLNNRTTLTYTSTGRVQTDTDANDHTTTYQYDSQDRVTTVLFPDGTSNGYAYNASGLVTKFTDGRGNATTYSYDSLNRMTGKTDALGNHATYTYDPAGNLTKDQEPTPAGLTARTTSYAYDTMNRVVTVTNPLGGQTIYGYDSSGNRTSVTDPMGRISTTVYDALNRPTATVDPMNNRTTVAYDAEGQVLTVTDPLNRVTTYSYSARGWVSTVTDPMGFVATYVYTPTGKNLNSYQYVNGKLIQVGYSYDADDRLTTFTDGMGDTTGYSYDGVGNQTSVTDGLGHATSFAYDSRNRLTTMTDALGHTTVYGYDGSGNQQTVTDGLGHTTTTLYDALNRATTITSTLGGITTILYDAASRQTGLIDPVGNRTTWAYDANDRLTTMTDPLNHSATYVYDADGELTDTTDRNGRRTTYSYNADGDQTGETWVGASPSERVTYTYDADNELTGATDSFATLTYTCDNDGRLSTAATSGPGTGQPAVTLTYAYDQAGNETSVADSLSSQGVTTYQYDAAFRLTTVSQSNGGTAGPRVVFGYDAANRLTSILRTNAADGISGKTVATTLIYDNANRLVTMTDQAYTTFGTPTYSALATYAYSYDSANRVTSEKDAEGTASFSYDNTNQLTTVTGSRSENYSYDLNGNRNSSGYTTGTNNELSASPGYTYTYDNDGNLVSQTNTSTHAVTSYTYDYRNRLTNVTVGGTIVATYTYDALNRRIGVKDSGTQTWTAYDGTSADAHPYADFNGSATLTMRYLSAPGAFNGTLTSVILARTSSGGTTAWYLTDRLGSVRDVVSTSGTELDHIVYDSFGNIVTETNASNGDRFKFAGMELDPTTGQYYDRARYYGEAIGRFVGQDPLGFPAGDANLYRYVSNAPTNSVDQSGMVSEDQLHWYDFYTYYWNPFNDLEHSQTHPSDAWMHYAMQCMWIGAALSAAAALGCLAAGFNPVLWGGPAYVAGVATTGTVSVTTVPSVGTVIGVSTAGGAAGPSAAGASQIMEAIDVLLAANPATAEQAALILAQLQMLRQIWMNMGGPGTK